MDSTLVVQLTHLAGQLGMEARTVLIWWFLSRFGVHVLWAGVVVSSIFRMASILQALGRGQALLQILSGDGRTDPTASEYAAGQRVLLELRQGKTTSRTNL
jgi:hypothetical protein